MLKIAGMVLIIFSTTKIGFEYSNRLKKRLCSLKEIEKIISIVRGEIKYRSTVLEEAFENAGNRTGNEFADYFSNISMDIKNNKCCTMKEISRKYKDKLSNTYLNEKDKEGLVEFIGNLGYLDMEMQMANIEMYITQINELKKESEEQIFKNCKLYRYLGVMAGIILCIIIA